MFGELEKVLRCTIARELEPTLSENAQLRAKVNDLEVIFHDAQTESEDAHGRIVQELKGQLERKAKQVEHLRTNVGGLEKRIAELDTNLIATVRELGEQQATVQRQTEEIRRLYIRLKDAGADVSESNLFSGSVLGTAKLLAKAQERSRRRKREAGVQSIPMSFRAGLSGFRPPVPNSQVTSSTPLYQARGQADQEWSLPELSGCRVKDLMRAHAEGRQPDSTPLSGSDVPPRKLDDEFEGVEEKYAMLKWVMGLQEISESSSPYILTNKPTYQPTTPDYQGPPVRRLTMY